MRKYIVNPDRSVVIDSNASSKTSFRERLDKKFPTKEADKIEFKELSKYDEHKLYK